MRVAASPSRSSDLFIYLLHFIRSFHSRRAILRSSSVQDKKVKIDIPNVNNNSKQLALAARGYQIILRRPSLVVIDVGPLWKVRGGIFETYHMANHLPSRLCFDLMNNYFCKKKSTASGKLINGGSRERALRGAEFQRGTQFLKINRISLSYGLASNKDETFIIKVALFSCYIEEYVDCVSFSGALGTWPRWAPLDPPLRVMAPRPRLIRISVCLQNLKTISAQIISKSACKLSPA